MTLSEPKIKILEKMKKKALALRKLGHSYRAIADILVKEDQFMRSHEWVRTAILLNKLT